MLEYLGRTSQCRLSMRSHNLGMLGARCLANATLSILEPFLMLSPWEHLNFFLSVLRFLKRTMKYVPEEIHTDKYTQTADSLFSLCSITIWADFDIYV